MSQISTERSYRLAFFSSVTEAENAIHALRSAGFPLDQLAVICPERFQNELDPEVPRAERPGSHVAEAIVEGGVVGAAIGGVGLAAMAIATGGVGILVAAPVLIGGGALAGGFSGLILNDGYGKEIGEHYEEAIRLGRIVVGVHVEGEDSEERLDEAERILTTAGGTSQADMKQDFVKSV